MNMVHETRETLRDAFDERMESIRPSRPPPRIPSDSADSASSSDADTIPIAPFQTFKGELDRGAFASLTLGSLRGKAPQFVPSNDTAASAQQGLSAARHLRFSVPVGLKCNCEYLIAGLLLGLHFPTVSWLLLTGVFAGPSVIVFRHSEWFQSTNMDSWLDLSKILGLCLTSDVFALYCLSNVLEV